MRNTEVDAFQYSGTTSKLTSVTASSTVGGSVTYDVAGNETVVGLNSYQYSPRNELTSASGPEYYTVPAALSSINGTAGLSIDTPWTYKYDGNGTRLSTTINVLAPTTSTVPGSLIPRLHLFTRATRYSIPGPDGQLATETSTTNIGLPAYDYVWMGGKPIAQIDATGTHYDFTDHLDAPTIQTNAAGAVTYQADYEPYGSVYDLRGTANPHQPLRLPGQTAEQFDTGANGATDLSYNNARWYRPEWGQYSQADPIGLSLGDNLFDYVEGSPTSLVDPNGLFPIGNPFSKQPYDSNLCAALFQKMANLLKSIGRRTGDLNEDSNSLPERSLGDLIKKSLSRAGHRMLITADEINLQETRGDYDRFCDDPPPGASCPDSLPGKIRRSKTRWWSNYPSEQPPLWIQVPPTGYGDGIGSSPFRGGPTLGPSELVVP